MRTIVWWRRAGVKAIGLTMLAGCSSRTQGPQFPPVDAAQRVSVLDASAKLRVVFNGDRACEAIYSGAAKRFQSFPKESWLVNCARLQSDMGSWQSFDHQSMDRCGMPEVVVCVIGDGAFTKGNRILSLTWFLDSGGAQLLSISWLEGTERISIPPYYRHNYQDTPPVPGKTLPEKS